MALTQARPVRPLVWDKSWPLPPENFIAWRSRPMGPWWGGAIIRKDSLRFPQPCRKLWRLLRVAPTAWPFMRVAPFWPGATIFTAKASRRRVSSALSQSPPPPITARQCSASARLGASFQSTPKRQHLCGFFPDDCRQGIFPADQGFVGRPNLDFNLRRRGGRHNPKPERPNSPGGLALLPCETAIALQENEICPERSRANLNGPMRQCNCCRSRQCRRNNARLFGWTSRPKSAV